jgi:hypothetical protein
MRQRVLIVMAFFSLMAESCEALGQGKKVPLTEPMRTACKAAAGFSEADCQDLAQEFYEDKTAATVLKPSLQDPFVHLAPFIAAERVTSFMEVGTQAIRTDVESNLQAAQNAAAQILSTKAAVNQTGAGPTSSGSTTLVTKPTTTDLISLAAESGAFTDTVNGNTLTAQANADGLRRYLSGDTFSPLVLPTGNQKFTKFLDDSLNHLNLTATFTVAQSGTTGVSTTGSATPSTPSIASIVLPSSNVSFNSLSVNYSLYRPYNPRSKNFISSWRSALLANKALLDTAMTTLDRAVVSGAKITVIANNDPNVVSARTTWLTQAKNDEAKSDFSQFVKDYAAFCKVFVTALRAADPINFDSDILTINSALEGLSTIGEKVLDDARGKPLFTLVYTYSTPQSKPATHAATFAGAYVWKSGIQLSGNAAGTWFASVPAGATYGRVQSYQFSGELDQPIGKKTAPRAIFSLAGYGQYQYSPTVLNITSGNLAPGTDITLPSNAQVLLGTAGWLGVAQTKLVFNIGKGASIPVAVKWSNKTDLVNGSDWKGQFGFSYDLSAISAMLSGKN